MSNAYFIEIERRELADGRTIFSVTVGQEMQKEHCERGDGRCAAHTPAYSRDEAVEKARELLDGYREHDWMRAEGRPKPTADNTALRDDTGEFSMDEFFDRGTLAVYLGDT